MKKEFVFWVFLCGFIFIMISCDNCELKILGEDSSIFHALKSQEGAFEENSETSLSFRPNSFENASEKAIQDFINHTGLYDVILQYNFSLSTYVEEGYVWPIDSLLAKYYKNNKRSLTFEDELFPNAWKEVGWYYKDPSNLNVESLQKIGYPFATNTLLLVYNKNFFEKEENKRDFKKRYGRDLDVPTDWEQFWNIAEFFTKDNNYGICLQGSIGGWLYYEYCTFLFGMKGSVFEKQYGWESSKDKVVTITSPEAISATKYYLGLKKFNKGDYFSVDAMRQVKLIQEGDVAMGLVWSDYLYELVKDGKSSRFGFAPIPGDDSPIAGGCYYVNRDTKNPEAATDFILYMMQPETQVELALNGLCSPLKSTYENQRVIDKIPYSKALKTSLERGKYMFEAGLECHVVCDIINDHIQRLWRTDNPDVEKELDQIKRDIDARREDIYK